MLRRVCCIFLHILQRSKCANLFSEKLVFWGVGLRFCSMFGNFLDFYVLLLSRVLDGLLLDVGRFCFRKRSMLVFVEDFVDFAWKSGLKWSRKNEAFWAPIWWGRRQRGGLPSYANSSEKNCEWSHHALHPCGGSANLCAAPSAAWPLLIARAGRVAMLGIIGNSNMSVGR